LRGLIEGRYPDDGVLSEETADSPERLRKRRCWIVDPLDGTAEYGQLREDWAVHIALAVDGLCAVGAVALPAEDRLIYGVALSGHERAGLDGATGDASKLVRGDSPAREAPRMVCSRSHTPEWMERFARELGSSESIHYGSVGFKVSRLLLGEADVYVHRKGLKEWDTCAPEVVARALGWHASKLKGEPHTYNRPNPRNHELLACRPAHLARVLESLQSSGALAD
jgi:3'(2'), 5'-bisphosphate nucleotidase